MYECPIIGVLGGGQLGRMLALAGLPLGLQFRFLEPTADCPAADVGQIIVAEYTDRDALARFAQGLTLVTYEFENIPAETLRWLHETTRAHTLPIFPSADILAIAQDRLLEKQLFRLRGIGTPDFASVTNLEELASAAATLGLPAVLKTRRMGYDGKGQAIIRVESDIAAAWQTVSAAAPGDRPELILESFVQFTRELSIISSRSTTGELHFYPLTQNTHREGVLRESIAPAPALTTELQQRAESIARGLLEHTRYVGVLAIELFELADGILLANEMAPRVHNSGHWTQNGAEVSQFELHIRAIMGWPLVPQQHSDKPYTLVKSAMLNLLRTIPAHAQVLAIPGAHLHLYNKEPRAGQLRKVGHINITAPDDAALAHRLDLARTQLKHYL